MISHEGRPTLVAYGPRRPGRIQVFADRSRRHRDAEFQKQLIRDPFLAPGWILSVQSGGSVREGFLAAPDNLSFWISISRTFGTLFDATG
jgi:hypothetical protein